MSRNEKLSDLETQLLYLALTGFRCHSYDELAAATGWTNKQVDHALRLHRKTATRDPQGTRWTVAPLPHGRYRTADGARVRYHFVVVDAVTGQALTDEDRISVLRGGIQALCSVNAQMTNFATAIRMAAAQLPPPERPWLLDVADILVGAGKMTAGANQRLAHLAP